MSETLKKSDTDKLDELYEDWYGPPRDKDRAFRGRVIGVETWYLNQVKKEELEAAEVKGRRYLGEQVISLIRFVGFAGLVVIAGLVIRFINSYPGGGGLP